MTVSFRCQPFSLLFLSQTSLSWRPSPCSSASDTILLVQIPLNISHITCDCSKFYWSTHVITTDVILLRKHSYRIRIFVVVIPPSSANPLLCPSSTLTTKYAPFYLSTFRFSSSKTSMPHAKFTSHNFPHQQEVNQLFLRECACFMVLPSQLQ